MGVIASIIIVLAFVLFIKGVKIVRQAEVMIVERLGQYNRILESGLRFMIPGIESTRGITTRTSVRTPDGRTISYFSQKERIDLRETVYDFPKQNVITKDNASITINALIYFQIMDPKNAVYAIENLPEAIEKLTQTTLRNLVGQLDLEETLVSRDTINDKLQTILDEATNKWGVKVNRVELQDIIPPAEIQEAMDKLLKADRDKRAAIKEAEGLKQSSILKAEGEKEAKINKAEGEKQSAILLAQGEAQARVVAAAAEAQAIQKIIEAIKDNGQPDKYLIAMKYLETLKTMTEGENNKVVYMPYEATGVLSSLDGIKQMLDGVKK